MAKYFFKSGRPALAPRHGHKRYSYCAILSSLLLLGHANGPSEASAIRFALRRTKYVAVGAGAD